MTAPAITAPAITATPQDGISPAELLEQALGDPWRPGNPFGLGAGVERDAAARYPSELEAELVRHGLGSSFLPRSLGGGLDSLEQLQLLARSAARRDANAMPATMFSISAVMAVLAAGSPAQRETVAGWVRDGLTVAFALSEEHAGSDLLANTCRLVPTIGGWLLEGEKWLVGRGATADAALVVARTGERGPAAFTAVLLGPGSLADASVRRGTPVPTSGMRGIDFADLRFDGCPVPAGAVVGGVGGGLAAALRAQQLVRLVSTAGCLATGDTALRVALRFAADHRVGGVPVGATPWVRRELAAASAELLAVDATVLAAGRLAHLAPGRFGLGSAVVKRVATRLSGSAVARCRGVLGARAVLAEGLGAVLDKAARDNAMVEVIDTSVAGNLRSVALHLPVYHGITAHDTEAVDDRSGELLQTLARDAFSFGTPVPELQPSALDLGVRPQDPVLLGILRLAESIAARLRQDGAERTAELVLGLPGRLTEVFREAAAAQRDRSRSLRHSTEPTDLADRCCLLYAASAAALTWWANGDRSLYGARPGDPGWLLAVLSLLTALDDGRDPLGSGADLLPAYDRATALADAGLLFTALPLRLAEGPAGPDERGGE